jgi:hypothetical protein
MIFTKSEWFVFLFLSIKNVICLSAFFKPL